VDAFLPIADARQATIRASSSPGAVATVDVAGFRQILLNYLDNAVRYGPSGQTIDVSLERRHDRLRVVVRDEGPGIPDSSAARIWLPFTRLSQSRDDSAVGCGLGLAIVRDLAQAMGARVGLLPQPRGASFFIELPAAA
jgi:signal transduction histidine kinase